MINLFNLIHDQSLQFDTCWNAGRGEDWECALALHWRGGFRARGVHDIYWSSVQSHLLFDHFGGGGIIII